MQHGNSRRVNDGGHLHGMRKEDSRDPSLNQSRTPLPAWENALRPSRSSNRVLFLRAAAAAALAAFVAFNGWRDSDLLRKPLERQAAPTKPPEVNASPAPRYEEGELEPRPTPRSRAYSVSRNAYRLRALQPIRTHVAQLMHGLAKCS